MSCKQMLLSLTKKNSQVFPLYSDVERLPSRNSALVRICQKRTEYNEMNADITDGSD